jgi:glutamate-1-semialdehyde 2,1-aminomutase
MTPVSEQLFDAAQRHIPGGVNSPVRAFKGVGGNPLFIKHGIGAWLTDEDNREYVDYVGSWGPMILGHAHPRVLSAVAKSIENGLGFGAPTRVETAMADKLCSLLPHMEMVRMVSSGTEATMSAIRLARGHTGRDKIVKFEGCYHGHSDSLLVKAGSGALTLGVPSSPGVPDSIAEHTITLNYNDIDCVKQAFSEIGHEVACIIVEPVAGNMNCIPPQPGFLECLREVCDESGALLIFDEVMTGFRLAPGGAQERLNIKADIATYGKVIGGGLPVGAFAASKEIMSHLAPEGPVYQAGTLSGNPLAMAAGLAMLTALKNDTQMYVRLDQKTERLHKGMEERISTSGLPYQINRFGSMISLHFTDTEVVDFATAAKGDNDFFKGYFHGMLAEGVYLPPSAYESYFLNDALSNEDIDFTLEAFERVIKGL